MSNNIRSDWIEVSHSGLIGYYARGRGTKIQRGINWQGARILELDTRSNIYQIVDWKNLSMVSASARRNMSGNYKISKEWLLVYYPSPNTEIKDMDTMVKLVLPESLQTEFLHQYNTRWKLATKESDVYINGCDGTVTWEIYFELCRRVPRPALFARPETVDLPCKWESWECWNGVFLPGYRDASHSVSP